MSWQQTWESIFGLRPADPLSREVSVQEVLADLIAGHRCAWFEPYEPTPAGREFLESLWQAAFGAAGDVTWFVSEYDLPVPPTWRAEIPFTYRCPDFACGDGDRVFVIELKTERSSYDRKQIVDYLRLARHKLPDCWTDIALLGPHRPGATPPHDDRQRYAELTWADTLKPLAVHFPGVQRAEQLSTFLRADLAVSGRAHQVRPAKPQQPAEGMDTDEAERIDAAKLHALRLAPSVAASRPRDRTERGIDVEFPTPAAARRAQPHVVDALREAGFDGQVSVWLWQPSSLGQPATPAGAASGRELRLAPKSRR